MVARSLVRLFALALAATIPLAACDDDDDLGTGPINETANLRIVNAAQNTTDIEVYQLGNDTPIATLDFRETTEQCVEVTAGPTAFSFQAGGGEIAATLGTLEEGGNYTLMLVGTGASVPRRAVLGSDEHTPAAGSNALRLVNVTSTSGDVYATTPTGAPAPNNLLAGGLGPLANSNASLGEYFAVTTERTRIRLYDAGTTTTARADFTLAGLPASRMATVVLTGTGASVTDRAFAVFPCE